MLDFARQFPRFEAQETIQDREVATHERDVRRSITANHTTVNMPSCTYSSARRGYGWFVGLLSSWWEIFSQRWVKNSPRMFFTWMKWGVSIKPIKDPVCYDLDCGRNLTVRMAMNPSTPLLYSSKKHSRAIFYPSSREGFSSTRKCPTKTKVPAKTWGRGARVHVCCCVICLDRRDAHHVLVLPLLDFELPHEIRNWRGILLMMFPISVPIFTSIDWELMEF